MLYGPPIVLSYLVMAVGTCHRPLSWITGHSYCPFKSIVWLSCIVSYRHYLRSKAIVDCYLGCRNLSPPIIRDNRSFVLSLAPTVDAVQHCCYLSKVRILAPFNAQNSRNRKMGTVYCVRLVGPPKNTNCFRGHLPVRLGACSYS